MEEEKEYVTEEVQYPITLSRDKHKDSGPCGQCVKDTSGKNDLKLTIGFQDFDIILCAQHEGELLQVLLSNYVKRRQKKRVGGFDGELEK